MHGAVLSLPRSSAESDYCPRYSMTTEGEMSGTYGSSGNLEGSEKFQTVRASSYLTNVGTLKNIAYVLEHPNVYIYVFTYL